MQALSVVNTEAMRSRPAPTLVRSTLLPACLFLLFALALLLQDLLDDLLLLNQEGPHDPVADAVAAS